MSILTELRAAFDELDAARTEFDKPMPVSDVEFYKRKDRLQLATSNVQKLATDDTIRALLDVAEAADIFCACERGGEPISRMSMEIALAPLVEEDCPTCHGLGGGGGFDRNGSHTEERYCEYPCPTCGKEATDE